MLTIELLSIPDIRRQLTTSTVGRMLHLLGDVDSTNIRCRTLARAGAPEGTVVLAERQHAGRGRRGQTWFSPGRVNLYASVLLRPVLKARELPLFSFIAPLALVNAFDEHGARVGIKWPNEIVVEGRKVAGTLVESAMRGEHLEYTVLGVGANLNGEPDAVDGATSLATIRGDEVDRNAFAATFLNRLDEWLEVWKARGPRAVSAAWADHDVLTGKLVEVRDRAHLYEARVLGLDVGGGLVVEDTHGRRHTLVNEQVTPL